MKYQASDGDTAQTETAVDNNDVPELVREEKDELEICSVRNNKDITGEDALAKDLIHECEGAEDGKNGSRR